MPHSGYTAAVNPNEDDHDLGEIKDGGGRKEDEEDDVGVLAVVNPNEDDHDLGEIKDDGGGKEDEEDDLVA
ncbi:hypothetical protein SLEP1_g41493 [Rubroshorea leprosula]|uniref:Uncharacterized protein n=1 Tax=Rubroshorea leprosula TaxID=152421 RepID=A0AAV5L6T6_9ROSI|nr:hypothetical protein SLEP1_g41493 [Rubroshorea leprosula]